MKEIIQAITLSLLVVGQLCAQPYHQSTPRSPYYFYTQTESLLVRQQILLGGKSVKVIPDSAFHAGFAWQGKFADSSRATLIADSTKKVPSNVALTDRVGQNFTTNQSFGAQATFNGGASFNNGIPAFNTPTVPFTVVSQNMVSNLNANFLEGYAPALTAAQNKIPYGGATGKLDPSWLPAAADSSRAAHLSDSTKSVAAANIAAGGTHDANHFLDGSGNYSTPAGSDSSRASFLTDSVKGKKLALQDQPNTFTAANTWNAATTFNSGTNWSIPPNFNNVTAAFTVVSTNKVTNLQADLLDGAHANATPTNNTIPIAGNTHQIDSGYVPKVSRAVNSDSAEVVKSMKVFTIFLRSDTAQVTDGFIKSTSKVAPSWTTVAGFQKRYVTGSPTVDSLWDGGIKFGVTDIGQPDSAAITVVITNNQ